MDRILKECRKQDSKWGEQNHDDFKWLAILGEEVGECNRAALEGKDDDLIEELIQFAAVAITAIESIERRNI